MCHLSVYLFEVGGGVPSTHLSIWGGEWCATCLFIPMGGWCAICPSIYLEGEWNAIFTSIYLELRVISYLLIHPSRLGSRVISTLLSIWNWGRRAIYLSINPDWEVV